MRLYVVGIGPGDASGMTPQATEAIVRSQVVVGYTRYLDLIEPLLKDKKLISTGMRGEVERCRLAIEAALNGKTVAVVSSGDAGVYGMASLILELAEPWPELEIEIIPGVTAATAAAALLGAPLGHDFAVISLSDLLTDWAVIEARLQLCAQADLMLCLYNPASRRRINHLARACSLVLQSRSEDTPCGLVRQAGRTEQTVRLLSLEELARTSVDMFTTVIIGNSNTRVINGRMVTPRGYRGVQN